MRRAIYFFLLIGVLAGVAQANDPPVYRGQTAAQWLQQLSHPSASARAAAAQAFLTIGKGNDAAVEPLVGLLSDRDARVRFYAAYALGKLEARPQPCIAALTKALPDTDEHVRYATQWSLAQIAKQITETNDGNTITDDSLANLLAEAETELMVSGALPGHLEQVRTAIACFDPPARQQATLQPPVAASSDENDEIARCLQEIGSDDVRTSVKAVEQLRRLGPESVQRLLASPESLLNQRLVHWHLPSVVASLGEPVVPALIQALQNPDDEMSELASNALMDLGPVASGAFPDLVKLLETEETSEAVRRRVVSIVKSMGPAAEGAIDSLVQLLNDVAQDDSIRASAAEALGSIGPAAKRAVPAMIERLSKTDRASFVRPEVASALVRIDPKSEEVTQSLIAAFQKSDSIFEAIGLAERLCECGPAASQIVPRLIEAIDDTSFDQRADLLRVLGDLGASAADEVSPLLFARLMDPKEVPMVRVAAAKGLGKLGPAGVQPIIEALQHGDEASQLTAARALVEIGAAASPAREACSELLLERDADDQLRALAAVALGQLGPEANNAVPALTELLRSPKSDGYLRSMCAVALGQIDPAAASVLELALDDAEAEVQIAAAYSLCKIDPRHAAGLAKLARWLESHEYRDSAIAAMVDIGETALPCLVETLNDLSKNRDTRVAGVAVISEFDDRAIAPLLNALNDQVISQEAGWALRDRGNKLLPTLVASMDDEVNFTPQARAIMGSVIEDMFSGLGGGDGNTTWEGGHALVKRPEAFTARAGADRIDEGMAEESSGGSFEAMEMRPELVDNLDTARDVESTEAAPELAELPPALDGYKTVDVFYGTNRKPTDETSEATAEHRSRWFWWAAFGLLVVVIILVGLYRRGARRQATAGLAGTTLFLVLALLLFAPSALRQSIDKSGPSYGGEYSEWVEMGICQVTIPETHREGELETPTLLRLQVAEDLQKHIVLRSVRRLESEAFFTGLQKELQSQGNNVLVFIHGYNVSFEDAARRTAQMSSDLKFAGAPVFYSWPSQAQWWKYRVDEKNVELSVDQLKTFLLAIAERSGADTINLVAHSMGNRALTDALREMDIATTAQSQLFNQVILAAPDIDADIFKQRIAPAIVTKAKHFTLYASSRDLALVASRKFNSGDPRAGDAGENLVVCPGIETIDVSSGDSSLLGHSYYGDNVSVLRDIEFLLRDQPAHSRPFLEPVSLEDNLMYWRYQPARVSRRFDANSETR